MLEAMGGTGVDAVHLYDFVSGQVELFGSEEDVGIGVDVIRV